MTYTIKINNVELPNVRSYRVGVMKLFEKAGRNMSGDLKGNFVGTFHKIGLEFSPMSDTDMQIILPLLAEPFFTVSYWNEKDDNYLSAEFYAGDFEYPLRRKDTMLYDSFSVNLIATKKIVVGG
jgi:hypothetical protein